MGGGRLRVLGMALVATLAVGCGAGGTASPAADLDEMLLDRGYEKPLTAIDVRTCATRELPITGHEPVAFTRDHKTVATMRRIETGSAQAALPYRLTVGPASDDERDTVWTVGDSALGGMAFDPSGERIALGLQRSMDRGSGVAPGAVDDGLWIVNRSGDGQRQLVPGYPQALAWSPDGSQIASTTAVPSAEAPNRTQVWVVDVGSGRQRTVTTLDQPSGVGGVMDWSPDGQNLLLFTGKTDPSTGRPPPNLEQIGVADGRRTMLLGSAGTDFYHRAVYAPGGRTIIARRSPVRSDPPSPPGGPSVTTRAGAPDRRTADLVSIPTDGTELRSLCPIDPGDTLLDWH